MTTGDIKNNLRKLQSEIKLLKYPETADVAGLSKGIPTAFLPIYHYAFTQYSPAIAAKIAEMDIELFGKSDLRFMEAVYKILRDMFKYKPLITKDQFFSSGFAERKVIMTTEIVGLIRAKKRELQPTPRGSASLRVNSSMDSLNSLKVNTPESRRVSMIETSKAKKIAKETVGRTHRAGKTETVGLTRPSSAPTGRPPKPMAVKHKGLDVRNTKPAEPEDGGESNFGTPSIIRVRPMAVEVVRLPREGEVNSSQPPAVQTDQTEVLSRLSSQMSELFKMVEDVMNRVSFLEVPVNKMSSPLGNSTMIQPPVEQVAPPPQADVKWDLTGIKQQQETILARLILLENRMAMMEAKMIPAESPMPVVPVVFTSDSPSTVKNSNKGAFVCVESFVHGDKMVRKLHASPEKPIRNLMNFDDDPKPVEAWNGGGIQEGATSDRSTTPESDVAPTPDGSSSPELKDANIPCLYIDEFTQNKVERIKNLFNETDGMLKNIGTPNLLLGTPNPNSLLETSNPNSLLDNLNNSHPSQAKDQDASHPSQAKDQDADVDEKELADLSGGGE